MACTFIYPPDPPVSKFKRIKFSTCIQRTSSFFTHLHASSQQNTCTVHENQVFPGLLGLFTGRMLQTAASSKISNPFSQHQHCVSISHMHITNVAFTPWQNYHTYGILSVKNIHVFGNLCNSEVGTSEFDTTPFQG